MQPFDVYTIMLIGVLGTTATLVFLFLLWVVLVELAKHFYMLWRISQYDFTEPGALHEYRLEHHRVTGRWP